MFLCHAWPDRLADAKDVYDLLVGEDVSVWFSEVSLRPGTDMRVAIERGLVSSRTGIVLVTPAMLDKLRTDRSVANNELSALLRRNLLVPAMHGVTFEELDQVSSHARVTWWIQHGGGVHGGHRREDRRARRNARR
ncbi:MAG TPA: toll/interleukin-1 receptor domain-containing protein [Jiangellaceae bacterium]|nr:toll/interleukin-1 receptor domain-containing protein [Jiangellaceae bacterium]